MKRSDLDSLFDLTDRVAIVTGGTRGIGRSLAEGYIAAGAKVVVASRKADACAESETHLRALGGEALGVPTHIGNLDDIDRLVQRTLDTFGGIDIVVNNAANPLALDIGEITPAAWSKSMEVNLRGPVFLVQAALPALRSSRHAAVLNVLAASVYMSLGHVSLYVAAKTAMLSFTRSMAAELGPQGIRVNALCPGSVDTDLLRNNPVEVQEEFLSLSIMRRAAQPNEMVGPALLLTSDAGSFITGQSLLVDGGSVAH
jgi:NAD(P)-dependent dehydrogenase (short-subunit alcohol dehydrogenase family)